MAITGHNELGAVQLGYHDLAEPNEHLDLVSRPQTQVSPPQSSAPWRRFLICFKRRTELIYVHALEFG
jgi:hypothetical protein